MQRMGNGKDDLMMGTPQFLGDLPFDPDFGFRGPALRTGAMLAGVVSNDPVIIVGAVVNMITLGWRAARQNILRRSPLPTAQRTGRFDQGIMIGKYLLDDSSLHRPRLPFRTVEIRAPLRRSVLCISIPGLIQSLFRINLPNAYFRSTYYIPCVTLPGKGKFYSNSERSHLPEIEQDRKSICNWRQRDNGTTNCVKLGCIINAPAIKNETGFWG